ncbi:hypothetical protein P1X14_01540 [Sphingomonas sp. AOB5]|uniref:hypothetical protein n=1 Tax=Sphingomonas sp. AOB5 TaxID=3034017 RepID=UPI0023F7AA66|nr:hypothetical protein [Sphingomonas sp. AOB5]MDF7773915.1 hypothetical protein [Sphingomonas sp. AOB5]
MIRKGFLATAAAWAALAATGAHAQSFGGRDIPCLEAPEAEAVMLLIAPGAIKGVTQACTPHFTAGAFLTGPAGRAQLTRYEAAAKAAEPAAGSGIAKLLGLPPAAAAVPGSSAGFASLAQMMVMGELDQMDTLRCYAFDRMFHLLDPLPPKDVAGVLTVIAELGSRDGKKPLPITICPRKAR